MLGFEDRNIIDGPPGTKASFLLCVTQGLDLFEVSQDAHGAQEMNHMALNVDADDMEQLVTLLSQAGFATPVRTPRDSVFIFDPDGHRRAPGEPSHRVDAGRGLTRSPARTALQSLT